MVTTLQRYHQARAASYGREENCGSVIYEVELFFCLEECVWRVIIGCGCTCVCCGC